MVKKRANTTDSVIQACLSGTYNVIDGLRRFSMAKPYKNDDVLTTRVVVVFFVLTILLALQIGMQFTAW